MSRPLLIAAGVLVLLVVIGTVFGATYRAGYSAGAKAEELEQKKAIEDYQDQVRRLQADLDKKTEERRVEYRDRIKIVREAADPTGCLDTDLPQPVLDSLHKDRPG